MHSFLELLILLKLLGSSGGNSGCLPVIMIVILAIIIVFLFEHIWLILSICIIGFLLLLGIAYIKDYLKYKDETEEERAERLKLEEMLDKWRKQFK